MRDLEAPRQELAAAHREVMAFVEGIARSGNRKVDRQREEYVALMEKLGGEDGEDAYLSLTGSQRRPVQRKRMIRDASAPVG